MWHNFKSKQIILIISKFRGKKLYIYIYIYIFERRLITIKSINILIIIVRVKNT